MWNSLSQWDFSLISQPNCTHNPAVPHGHEGRCLVGLAKEYRHRIGVLGDNCNSRSIPADHHMAVDENTAKEMYRTLEEHGLGKDDGFSEERVAVDDKVSKPGSKRSWQVMT
ncbi:MAG: hypothetical protein UW22_C0017G0014 [Candidatus Gottesmanbacteria bacterium GW2011_GWB1_44_11c]|uniref:Uncharacterized protein n=1 Tax=Candidatus Gottesmanbacteria bacterium GW2011_GWB1_44_11c TaxID=1618447 RepID=A0A0G1GRZ1_9BACT|nr:MAG: hypothetical protein UW22_C0017G0014 [Candidatus Gottesmanbacteria bacterium GW2011_GWB1_44_11c]